MFAYAAEVDETGAVLRVLVIPAEQADRGLDQALMFVESIGFLMNDLDIQILSATDRALLWDSLPLRKGSSDRPPPEFPNRKPMPHGPPMPERRRTSARIS